MHPPPPLFQSLAMVLEHSMTAVDAGAPAEVAGW